MSDEWALLVIAQDIEPGDFLTVQRGRKSERMILVREEGKGLLLLKDSQKKIRQFYRQSLQEVGGTACIAGKATEA